MAEIIGDDAIRSSAVARIAGARAEPGACEVALANKAQECICSGIHQVDRVIRAIGEIVSLRRVVVPADIEGSEIGRGSLDQDRFGEYLSRFAWRSSRPRLGGLAGQRSLRAGAGVPRAMVASNAKQMIARFSKRGASIVNSISKVPGSRWEYATRPT